MYLSTLHSYPGVELTALCGRDQNRSATLAAKYGSPQVFTDYREMLKRADLQAVIVGAPDDLHHPMSLAAFDAGLHVLCDKPLAFNLAQAGEMLAAAQASKRVHMVLFTYRWMPYFRYVKDLLEQGLIGRLFSSEFRYVMGYARSSAYQWRLDRQRANGALGDLGVHMIDLARWLVGEIATVSAHSRVCVQRQGPDGGALDPANDSTYLLLTYADGSHGQIHASLVTHLGDRFMQQQVMLYGENGGLEIDVQYEGSQAGVRLSVTREPGGRFEHVEVPDTYWGSVDRNAPFTAFNRQPIGPRAFVDTILAGRAATPNFEDGYRAQQVIHAALESQRLGKWIDLKTL